MTEFDRLMREADLDRAREEVVRAAKTYRKEYLRYGDMFGYGASLREAFFAVVDELLRMEEKR